MSAAKIRIFAAALVIGITALAYLPSLNNRFVTLDDDVMLTGNPYIRQFSPANLKVILARPYAGLYHPVVQLSYALEYRFFGLDPRAYHLTNLILHLANCLLVFWFVHLLCGSAPAAFIVSLLFGIHPMHVESVAWISERKDMLYAFFFLAALVSYMYFRRDRGRQWLLLSLLLFLLSLLSKPMAISLPFVLIALDYILDDERSLWKSCKDNSLYFILSAAFAIVALASHYTHPGTDPGRAFSLIHSLFNASFNFVFYLYKLLVPVHLSPVYPYSTRFAPGITAVHVASLGLVLALTYAAIRSIKVSKAAAFSFFFFAITVFPVLQLVPVGQELPADRYMYLPALGLFYGIALLFVRGVEHGARARKIMLAALGIAACALLAQATWRQARVWHDGLSLWTHSLKWYPNSFLAYKGRGDAYKELGNFEAALADYRRALEIKPDYAAVYNNRGNLYSQLKDYPRALEEYSRAIAVHPEYAAAYYNRAIVYERMGFTEKAALDYLRIMVLDPSDAQSRNNLGVLYAREGRFEEAARLFSEAIAADHTLAPAYINRSHALRLLGRIPEADADRAAFERLKQDVDEGRNGR